MAGSREGAGGAGALMALAPMVIGMFQGGRLQKILGGFQQQGMGDKAESWVGTGDNQPVSPQDVRSAVGDEQVHQAAQQLGVSDDDAATVLAEVLPRAADRVTPEGQLPSEAELQQMMERVKAAQV